MDEVVKVDTTLNVGVAIDVNADVYMSAGVNVVLTVNSEDMPIHGRKTLYEISRIQLLSGE